MPEKNFSPSPRVFPPGYDPKIYFFLFLFTNALLAHSPFSLATDLFIGFFGLLLSLGLALRSVSPAPPGETLPHQKDFLPRPSPWLWLFLAAAAAALRLWKLETLSVWPMWDDGHYGYFAIDLAQKWRWKLFFGSEQYTPLYTWLQGLYFKVFSPSLLSMWVYPVLYSLAVLPLAYGAARRFCSPSFSFLYLTLFALGFWPVYVSKFSTDVGLNLIWQFVVLLLLIRFLESLGKDGGFPISRVAALGVAIGGGWYLSKFWVSSIPLFMGIALWAALQKPRRDLKAAFALFFFTLLPLLPFAYLAVQGEYGGHIQTYSVFGQRAPWARQLEISLSYVTAPLWGTLDKSYFNFGPLWGGLLNPLMGSAFLLGLVECSRFRKLFFPILLSLGVYLSAGALTNTVEIMRILPILPIVLFVAVFGLQKLFSSPSAVKISALGLLILFSLSLDLYHLWGPYRQWAVPGKHSGSSKSPERFRAFQILKNKGSERGPGLILDDLVPDIFDQTLGVASYPFNAACNPALSLTQAQWAGILVSKDLNGEAFQRFPDAKVYDLSAGLERYDQALSLWVVPVTLGNRMTLLQWTKANQAYRDSYGDMPYHLMRPSYRKVAATLLSHAPDFAGDPFLTRCLWAKMAEYLAHDSDDDLLLEAAPNLIRYTHPSSEWYFRLARAMVHRRRYEEAKKYFEIAGRLDPRNEPSKDLFRLLDLLSRTPASPTK